MSSWPKSSPHELLQMCTVTLKGNAFMHERKSISERESEEWGQTDRHRAGEPGERKEATNAHKSRQKDRPTQRNIGKEEVGERDVPW